MPLHPIIQIKRIYEPASAKDGVRVLVDGLWPRGLKKENAQIDRWMKEIAPSRELRRWFGHDPGKWQEFKKAYSRELAHKQAMCEELVNMGERLTLLDSAREMRYNHAVVLRDFLCAFSEEE